MEGQIDMEQKGHSIIRDHVTVTFVGVLDGDREDIKCVSSTH